MSDTKLETPEQAAEMRRALYYAIEYVQSAYGTANRIPAYHGYVEDLGKIVRELIHMQKLA